MNFKEYQELSSRTANNHLSKDDAMCNWVMGLCGEAGELTELVKKKVFHYKTLNLDDYKKELGDVLWYLSQCASIVGLDLEEVAIENIEKLKARYPSGFVGGGGVR